MVKAVIDDCVSDQEENYDNDDLMIPVMLIICQL